MGPLLLFCAVMPTLLPPNLPAQETSPGAFDLPAFLARYESGLEPLGKIYDELANQDQPLGNEAAPSLSRRNIEDRQRALSDLLQDLRQLSSTPEDAVVATRLFIQTETLDDDLFDLSQIAYYHDREELGKRLSELQAVMHERVEQLESFILRLAAEKQARLEALEKENQGLREKIQELSRPASRGGPRRQ